MPFRRLPDTDAGRSKALRTAKDKADNTPAKDLAFSQDTLTRLGNFQPGFNTEVQERGDALKEQAGSTKIKDEAQRIAVMFISHFLQVFNLGVTREKYSAADRAHYQLAVNQEELPSLSTESDVVLWGQNLISGEAARIKADGAPMQNPDISEVQTVYDDFKTKALKQSGKKDKYDKEQEDVEEERPEADDIVIDIWDEVEFTYRKDKPSSKRRKCREYGVVYVSRPGEEPEEGVLTPYEAEQLSEE